MGRFIHRVMWVFLGLFGLAAVTVIVYQLLYTGPEQRCLQAHHWWDSGQRVCGTPISLPLITGKANKPRP